MTLAVAVSWVLFAAPAWACDPSTENCYCDELTCGNVDVSSSDGDLPIVLPSGSGVSMSKCPSATGTNPGSCVSSGPPPPTYSKDQLQKSVAVNPAASSSAVQAYLPGVNVSDSSGGPSYSPMYDADGQLIVWTPSTLQPAPQGNFRGIAPAAVPSTEPVAGSGEFVVEETDLAFPGIGVPYRFTRYYRSGIDYQSPLGYGWNHNFARRLYVASASFDTPQSCGKSHPDVFYVNERMDRIRFSYVQTTSDGIDYYQAPQAVDLKLSRARGDWTLDDGGGLLHTFDGSTGLLSSVADFAGHAIVVNRNANNAVSSVRDTTGRTIYYVYQTQTLLTESFQSLQCLSLTNDCKHPLVSFLVRGVRAISVGGAPQIEPDLVGVRDVSGNGPTYRYYHDTEQQYVREFDTFIPSGQVDSACHAICDDRTKNCHNVDACLIALDGELAARCNQVKADTKPRAPNLGLDVCVAYCMSVQWDGTEANRQSAFNSCYVMAQQHEPNSPPCPQVLALCKSRISQDAASSYYAAGLSACRAQCLVQCKQTKTSRQYTHGTPPDLRHNLTRIVDGDGRVVVDNTYGEDPTLPDFDKVKTHVQNGGLETSFKSTLMTPLLSQARKLSDAASHLVNQVGANNDPANTITFEYHDLTVESRGDGTPNNALVAPLAKFTSIQICPGNAPQYGAPIRAQAPFGVQLPVYAVIIRDFHGVTWTNYHDSAWRLLRSINQNTRATIDYNYRDGFVQAVSTQSGARVCMELDGRGQPTRVTRYPALVYPGQSTPQVTTLQYDANEQVIQIVREPDGATPTGRRFIRDSAERVIAVGDQATTTQTNWTCFQYADGSARPPLGALAPAAASIFRLPPPLAELATSVLNKIVPQAWLFVLSGCAVGLENGQPAGRSTTRDALPSAIIHPDGSITKQSRLSADGAGDVIADSTGPDPIESFLTVQYGASARTSDSGRRVLGTPTAKTGTTIHSVIDYAGLLQDLRVQDPVTGAPVDTTYQYDQSHHRTAIVGPDFTRSFAVDAMGNAVLVTDAPSATDTHATKPRTTCRQFDLTRRLLQEVHPEGNLDQYYYDDDGRLNEIWRGYASAPLGDWAKACKPIIHPALFNVFGEMEQVAVFEYDAAGFLIAATQNGVRRTFTVDGFGRVLDTITPDTGYATLHQPNGTFTSTTYTINRHHAQNYDSIGRVVWEGSFDTPPPNYAPPTAPTAGLHAFTQYSYDRLNRTTETDRWRFTEDPIQIDAAGLVARTIFVFDDAHDSMTTTDEEGARSTRTWDALGHVKHEARAAGTPDELDTDYVYSQGGDQATRTFAPAPTTSGQLIWSYTFDPLGLVSQIQEGGRTLFGEQHDAFGRVRFRTALSDARSYEYDAFSRRVIEHRTVSANQTADSRYVWDGNDRLSQIVDGAGHSTTRTFDGLDRLTTSTNGIGQTTYHYQSGTTRVALSQDPGGTIATIEYNAAGRPSLVNTVDGASLGPPGTQETVEYRYTALGQLEQAIRHEAPKDVTVTFSYDSLGRRIAEQNDALPLGVERSYSPGVRAWSVVRGSSTSARIEEHYDQLYRTRDVTLDGDDVAHIDYAQGARAAIRYANQAIATNHYDDHARASGVTLTANGASLASLQDRLGADNVPRLRQFTFGALPTRTDLFQTDAAGRVTFENLRVPGVALPSTDITNATIDSLKSTSAPSSSYTLDGASNWTARTGAGAFTPVIDAANRYTKLDSNSVTHDAAGNVQAFNGEAYTWNGRGELTSASANGQKVSFSYDGLGRRIRETSGQSTTFFVWDDQELRALGADAPTACIRITDGADQTLALVNGAGTGAFTFVHSGPDGSVFAATDAKAQLIEGYSYSAYGETTFIDSTGVQIPASKVGNRFLYQGQLYDSQLGLYSMRAREYKPAWGRFLSTDPIGLVGGLNLYAFVDSQPLLFSDPSGLSGQSDSSFGSATPNAAAWSRLETINAGPGILRQTYDAALAKAADPNRSFWSQFGWGAWSGTLYVPTLVEELGRGIENLPHTLFGGAQTVVDNVNGWNSNAAWDEKVAQAGHVVGGVAQSVGAALAGGTLAVTPGGANGPATTAVESAVKNGAESPVVYRGVSADHPALDAALQGRVVPGNVEGTVTAEAHNLGGVAAESPYTSWTHSYEVAYQHAMKEGPGGVVLSLPTGAPPPGASWSWEWSPDVFAEQEVLLRGAREGATVIKP